MTTSAHTLPPIGLLKDLPESTRLELAQLGTIEEVPVGKKLAIQGLDHAALYIVISGQLRVSCHAHGDTVELAVLGEGDIVGEMSLLDPQPSSADVEVVNQPASVWSAESSTLIEFLDSNRTRGYDVLLMLSKAMCRRLRKCSDHMLQQADVLRSHFLDIDY